MKLVISAVALMMLAAVACGASAAVERHITGDAAPTANVQGQAVEDGVQVAALTLRVAQLEARLEFLQWTEYEVISVVKRELEASLSACGSQHSHSDGYRSTVQGCVSQSQYASDPVLRAIVIDTDTGGPGYFNTLLNIIGRGILEEGDWSAVREPDSFRWSVTGTREWADGRRYVNFYVYERTGLVDGIARTAEQIMEDFLKELAERNAVR